MSYFVAGTLKLSIDTIGIIVNHCEEIKRFGSYIFLLMHDVHFSFLIEILASEATAGALNI